MPNFDLTFGNLGFRIKVDCRLRLVNIYKIQNEIEIPRHNPPAGTDKFESVLDRYVKAASPSKGQARHQGCSLLLHCESSYW